MRILPAENPRSRSLVVDLYRIFLKTITPMNPEIRAFTIDDHPAVIALWQECEGLGLSDADSEAGVRTYLDRNPGMSFVATSGESLVGAILCGHDGRRGYIHHLAVHPDARRRSLARHLVDRCLEALKQAGIQKCHLFIFNDNADGIAFWESTGWTSRSDICVCTKDI